MDWFMNEKRGRLLVKDIMGQFGSLNMCCISDDIIISEM